MRHNPIYRLWLKRSACMILSVLGLFVFEQPGFGQSKFHITFRGVSYQKNAAGNLAPVNITEETILADAARAGGVTDLSSLALVYHVNGSSFGDTIDIVNATNGVPYTTYLGFFFGADPSLNRTALTNAPGTEVRRIDYLYTRQNSHSMGSGFVTKRYIRDKSAKTRTVIDGGQVQWIVLPEANTSARMCKATFTVTRAFP